ncbi:hypothetical protein C922_04049 [Plasmodium inui San Antonio 1]|uniref:Uncharacterized protein n=1 Tax=Plasmodium inui San Antonio 1 TaxID=1237626 RepID=W7A2I6_9APIC|nr:hypothetical protein C922_04049 [Plasmodium inui San Antonio 1]EUD65543.1 hypothetical protein C922_04049 [Plasmodium inui San Antonio 1]
MFLLRSSSNSSRKQPIEVDGNGKGPTSVKGEIEQAEDGQVKNLYNENPLSKIESYMDYAEQQTQVYPISRTTTPHQINIGSMESVHEEEGIFNPIAKSSTLLSHDEDELAKHINENDDENEEGILTRQTRSVNSNKYPLNGEQKDEAEINLNSGVTESGVNEKWPNFPIGKALQSMSSPQDGIINVGNNVSEGNGDSQGGEQFAPNFEKEPAQGRPMEVQADEAEEDDELRTSPLKQNDRVEGVSARSYAEEPRLQNGTSPAYDEGKPNDGEPNPCEESRNAYEGRNQMCKDEESKERFEESLINDSCVYSKEEVKSQNSIFKEEHERENNLDDKFNDEMQFNSEMQLKNENSERNSNEHFKNSLIKDILMQKESSNEPPSPIDQNKTLALINNLFSIKGEEGVNTQFDKLFAEESRHVVSNGYDTAPIVNTSTGGALPCGSVAVGGAIPAPVHGGDVSAAVPAPVGVGKSACLSHRETLVNHCVESSAVGSNNAGSNLVGSNLLGSTSFGNLASGGIHGGYAMASKEALSKSESIRKSKIICLSYLRILKRLTSIWSETNKSFEYHFVNILNNVEMNNLDLYLCCFSNIKISAAKSLFLDSIAECIDELEIIRKLKGVQGKEESSLYDKSTSFSSSSSSGNKNGKNEMLKQIIDEVESNLSKEIVDEMQDLSLRNPYFSSTYHGNSAVTNVISTVSPHVADGESSVLSLYGSAHKKGDGNHKVCSDSSGNVDLKKGKDFLTCGGGALVGGSLVGATPGAVGCGGLVGTTFAGEGSFPSYACSSHGNHFACPSALPVNCANGHMYSSCMGSGTTGNSTQSGNSGHNGHSNQSNNSKVNPLSSNYSANMIGLAGNNPLSYSNSFGAASNSCKKKCSYTDENILNKLNVSIDYNSYNDYSNNYIQEAEKVVEKYKNLSKLNSKESENMYSTCSQSTLHDVGNANVNAYLHFKSFMSEYANMHKGGGAERDKLKDVDLTPSDLNFLRYFYAHLCGSGGWEDKARNDVYGHEKDAKDTKSFYDNKLKLDSSVNNDMNKFLQDYKFSDEDNFDERESYTKYGRRGNKGGILNGYDNNGTFSSNSFQSLMRKRKLRDQSAAHHHHNHHSMQKRSGGGSGANVNRLANANGGMVSGITDLNGNSGSEVNANGAGMGGYDLSYLLCNSNVLKKLKFNLLEDKKDGSVSGVGDVSGIGDVSGVGDSGPRVNLPGRSGCLLGVLDFLKKDSSDYSVDENSGPHMNTRRSFANKNNFMSGVKNYKDILNMSQENFGKKGANGGVAGRATRGTTAAESSSPYKNGKDRDRERDVDMLHHHHHYPLHHPSLPHHHINPSTLYDFIMNTNSGSSGSLDISLYHPPSLLMNSPNGNNRNENKLHERGSGNQRNGSGNNNNGKMNMKGAYNMSASATSTATLSGLQKKGSYDFSADYNSKISANDSELSLSNNGNSSELLLGSGKMEGGISSGADGLSTSVTPGGAPGGVSPYKHSNKNENGKTIGMNNISNGGSKNIKSVKSSSTVTPVASTNYGIGKLKYEMPAGVNPNDDKVKGVYFSKSPRGVGKWNAYFQIANNKRLFTSFSVSKYGYNEARKLSILKRTEWEKEYRHHTDMKNADVKKGKKKSSGHQQQEHPQAQPQGRPQQQHGVNSSLVRNNAKSVSKGNNNHSINSNSDESISYGKENKLNEESSLMYSNDDEEVCLISDKLAGDISSEPNDLSDLNDVSNLDNLPDVSSLPDLPDSHILTGGGGKKVNKLNLSSGNNGSKGAGSGCVSTAGVTAGDCIKGDDNINCFNECTKNDNDSLNSVDLLGSSLNGGAEGDSNNNADGRSSSRKSALNGSGKLPFNSLGDSYGRGAENNNKKKQSVNSSRVLSNSIGFPNKYIRNLQFPAIDSQTVSNFLESVTDDQKISS